MFFLSFCCATKTLQMDLNRLNDSIAEMHLKFTSAGVICYMLISPWTLIRLFLGEQSDLGPNCLLQKTKNANPVQATPRIAV